MSLGESNFRSLGFVPFQILMYGDPLTRPFAHLPSVMVDGIPAGDAAGSLVLSPSATTSHPSATIDRFDLLVDGALQSSVADGEDFVLDTAVLGDGEHEIRVIAFDSTPVASQGEFVETINVDNDGLSVGLSSSATVGDLSTIFNVSALATGDAVNEIRLMQNGRVLAAAQSASASFPIPAFTIGAGETDLIAVADFAGGKRATSAPLQLDVAFESAPGLSAPGSAIPVAHDYRTFAIPGVARLLDLPATDADGDALTRTVIAGPSQGTLTAGANAFLLRPVESAAGTDTISFNVDDGLNTSNVGTVTIEYCAPPVILDQPADVAACDDDEVVLSVSTDADDASFQWYKDGAPIPGAVASTYLIDAASTSDEGLYFVEVSSPCADTQLTVESNSVMLSLLDPVELLADPIGATLCIGESWFAFVTAPGAESIQWFKNGEPIDGATNFFFSILDVSPEDSGEYTVQAGNACSLDVSGPAFLNVVGCGDGDEDGDIDFIDFGGLQACFTTEQQPNVVGFCHAFDFDGNGSVDLTDFSAFNDALTGP